MSEAISKNEEMNKLNDRYSELLHKEGVINQCVGFWAFNAVWGNAGKDLTYITTDFIKDSLKAQDILISDELAQCIIDQWVLKGQAVKTPDGYQKCAHV